jgi:L-cysteate sulfo-lyase
MVAIENPTALMAEKEFPNIERFARMPLLTVPTAIQRLSRLCQAIGPALCGVNLYVKRDDVAHIGGGGNKLRKLEFLIGEALAQGADTFITVGGLQSNHARLTAAASARAEMACELVLSRQVPRDDVDYECNGNILLDGLFGARVHALPGSVNPLTFAESRAEELRAEGRRVYVVGPGGSSPIGCLGYTVCAREVVEQSREMNIDFRGVIIANGSSGTHAGLAAGYAAMGLSPRLIRSYTVLAPGDRAHAITLEKASATLALLDAGATISPKEIDVDQHHRGDGYGIPTNEMLEAVRLMARTEGLLLDPVYSGKAFAGLLSDVKNGFYHSGDNVLFIMTGGTPGLFAYRAAFQM